MGTGKQLRVLFHVALVSCLLSMSQAAFDPPSAVSFFFPRKNFPDKDASNITWAHAVNSKDELNNALHGQAMMLEADIVMGFTSANESDKVPVMAHPPINSSDLTFEDFINTVIEASKDKSTKKGIKLDFKDIAAVEPCLKYLKDVQENIKFPIWLNADVLVGPVNATKAPVNGTEFIRLTKKYLKKATLSLGWTTRYGNDDAAIDRESKNRPIREGAYETQDIEAMLNLVESSKIQTPITFPLRAALAANSGDKLLPLIGHSDSSITLFSSEDDRQFINMTKLRNLVTTFGRANVYVDFPFDINSEDVPSPNDQNNGTDSNNDKPHDDNHSSSDLVRGPGMQVVVLLAAVFMINYLF